MKTRTDKQIAVRESMLRADLYDQNANKSYSEIARVIHKSMAQYAMLKIKISYELGDFDPLHSDEVY